MSLAVTARHTPGRACGGRHSSPTCSGPTPTLITRPSTSCAMISSSVTRTCSIRWSLLATVFMVRPNASNLKPYAPKGQPFISPGQRPGKWPAAIRSPERARFLARPRRITPFQGSPFPVMRFPGRCPGLVDFCPFGALIGPLRPLSRGGRSLSYWHCR